MSRILNSIMVVVAVLCLVFGFSGQGAATVILDQQNVIPISLNSYQTDESTQQTLGTYSEFAQTFTVGVSGTLVGIDVEVFHGTFTNGNAQVALVTTGAGVPDSSVLASWGITRAGSSDTVGSFVSLDLGASAFAVAPGQVYAIEFSWNPPSGQTFSGFYWVRGTSDTYAGGDAFSRNFGANPTAWTPNALEPNSYDYGFRTFVDVPTPIPEPSTMFLLGSGLIGLVRYGRKKFLKK